MNHRNRPNKPARGAVAASSSESLLFTLRSQSALRDFARLKPAQVRKIYCNTATKKQLLVDCPELGERHFSSEQGVLPTSSNAIAFSHAEVDISAVDEPDFLSRIKGRTKDIILVLDHIKDPRNLGAIMRSAAFFGVKEVLVAKKRQVLLTPASVATSQAAFALTDLVTVTNLSRTLNKLKEDGYWVFCCAQGGDAPEAFKGRFDKIVLIMGSEGAGISANIKKQSDLTVGIQGAEQSLESLNVGVAAGILLRAFSLD